MQTQSMFEGRVLRLSYWNSDARVVDADRMQLEKYLSRLGDVRLNVVKNLEAITSGACDLLIVAAQNVPRKEFAKGLVGLRSRVHTQGSIWVPALILADVGFDTLADILSEVTRENWYFDILAPGHLDSIPIRVANLVRIHDHLHELRRYLDAVEDVSSKVKHLEQQMKSLKGVDQ